MGPVLACGDTNAAVDNLVEGLLNKKLRVVRLGQPAKVGDVEDGRAGGRGSHTSTNWHVQYCTLLNKGLLVTSISGAAGLACQGAPAPVTAAAC
jgi:hypothetical protein